RGAYSTCSPRSLSACRLRTSRLAIPRPPLPLRRKFVHPLVEPLEQSFHPAPGRPTLEPLEEQAHPPPLGLLITVPSDEMAQLLRCMYDSRSCYLWQRLPARQLLSHRNSPFPIHRSQDRPDLLLLHAPEDPRRRRIVQPVDDRRRLHGPHALVDLGGRDAAAR